MKLISTQKAALIISELTGKPMSKRQVQTEIKLGHIPATLIGHSYVINEDDLKNYKRRHSGPVAKNANKDHSE